MASFVLSFFPLDVLDGIWDFIESVSEGFLTYLYHLNQAAKNRTKRIDTDAKSSVVSQRFANFMG